jgi:hypothetical protein
MVARKGGIGSATKEQSNDPQNQTFDIRAVGRLGDKLCKISIESDGSNDAVFNTFLDAVYEEVVTP